MLPATTGCAIRGLTALELAEAEAWAKRTLTGTGLCAAISETDRSERLFNILDEELLALYTVGRSDDSIVIVSDGAYLGESDTVGKALARIKVCQCCGSISGPH